MSKEMKKLVEEIKDRFCKFLCGGYNYGENRCDCYPRETWGTAQAQCSCLNDTVDFAIARIGKAVLSGEYPELDKLLGVVGRREWNVDMMVMPNGEMWGISKGSTLIAFCKEGEQGASDKAS